MDISFLIPSKTESRNVNHFLNRGIDSIRSMMVGTPYTWEIVVCSKHEIEGENIVWAQEPADNDGAVRGFNGAYWASKGDYVYTLIDDWYYTQSILKAVDFLKSD